jgi:hypothetical protein
MAKLPRRSWLGVGEDAIESSVGSFHQDPLPPAAPQRFRADPPTILGRATAFPGQSAKQPWLLRP